MVSAPLKRHRILAVIFVLAVLLVIIGWWLRLEPSGHVAEIDNASTIARPDEQRPALRVDSASPTSRTPDNDDFSCVSTFDALLSGPAATDSSRGSEVVEQALQDIESARAPGQVVFAAHVARSPERRIEYLADGINNSPDSAHLLWTAVNTCLLDSYSALCPDLDEWLEKLLLVDGENALAWSLAADAHLRAGRQDDALEAIRRAGMSYTVNEYWTDDIQASMDAVTAHGGSPEGLAYLEAIGFAAAFDSALSHYTVCKQQVEVSNDWAQACVALGKTVERGAMTYMTQGFGRGAQRIGRIALGESGETVELQALRRVKLPDNYGEAPLRYPDSPQLFMENLLAVGEIEAYKRIGAINRDRQAAGYRADCSVIRLDY